MSTEKKFWTIKDILQVTVDFFQKKGIQSPRLDAEVLLSHVLKKDRLYLYVNIDSPLTQEEVDAYRVLVAQRIKHKPIAYILGYKEFMGMNFKVTKDTLIPRPDTEILVECARTPWDKDKPLKILDLGTGTGAIIISLLKEFPNAQGVAVDISPAALEIAKENATNLGVIDRLTLLEGDMFNPISTKDFDMILSNPPYIPLKDMTELEADVKDYEPHLALTDQGNGLKYYAEIFTKAKNYLKNDGMVAVEIGISQDESVAELAEANKWQHIEIIPDYSGIPRVVLAWKK